MNVTDQNIINNLGKLVIEQVVTTTRKTNTSKASIDDSQSKHFVSVKQTNYSTQFEENLRHAG